MTPNREKRLLLAVKDARTPYVDSYLRALNLLLKEHKAELAQTVMVEQTTPALVTYHDAWNDLLWFEVQQARFATEKSGEDDLTTRRIGLRLAWLASILAAAIAVFATYRIASDTKARIRMQEDVSRMNAGLERRVGERTEDLARTEEQLRGSLVELQEYTKEIEAISELVELLQSCLTLDEARQQASRVLQQFFPSGSVLMLNSSRNLLDVFLSWGSSPTKQGPFAPDSCWALRKGRVHLVQPNNFSLMCGHIDEASASCHFCIPMVAQGDSLGVLAIDDPDLCDSVARPHLRQRKQELATTVAEQISLALPTSCCARP